MKTNRSIYRRDIHTMVCNIFYFLFEIWCWQVFDQHFIWNLWQIIFSMNLKRHTYSYKSLSHIFWPEITTLLLWFKERKMFCKACFKELAYYNTVWVIRSKLFLKPHKFKAIISIIFIIWRKLILTGCFSVKGGSNYIHFQL